MESDRSSATGFFAIVATYVYFLLFAQFGFLHRAQSLAGGTHAIMAAMGAAGLLSSFLTARALKFTSLLRPALIGCAATAILSLFCRAPATLVLSAALIGFFAAMLTVSLSAQLQAILGTRNFALKTGAATGLAYFICNLPPLFEGSATIQALVPAALCLACAAAPLPRGPPDPVVGSNPDRVVWGFVVMFLALVALDSSAFAIIQQTRLLKDHTWQTPLQKLTQGAVHFAAAVMAGRLIDRGWLRGVLWMAFALFAVALPATNGPLYAVGISFYSVALVVFPSRVASAWPARWRAALVYGISGWLGSALGIGAAGHVAAIPVAGVLAAGLTMMAGSWWNRRVAVMITLFVAGAARAGEMSDQVARGRRVYIQEGCINCHSQFIRRGTRDEEMWGPYRPVDFNESPPLIGNRRQGPDLMNVGNRRHPLWQKLHLMDPASLSPGSKMPAYSHLFSGSRGDDLVAYLSSLGATTLPDRVRTAHAWTLPPAPASTAKGRALFARSCSPCHGNEGDGRGPVSDALNDPAIGLRDGPFAFATGPDQRLELARIVKFGIPGLPMPGHEYFSDEDIHDLVAYLENLDPN